jgi:ketosteroid isomerase-like protein
MDKNMSPVYTIDDWLLKFEKAVNNRDFECGLNLYADSVLLFGTRIAISIDMNEYLSMQWRPIWNISKNFKFTRIEKIAESGGLQICTALWQNTSEIKMISQTRSGRATIVLQTSNRGLLAIHSHFSENPGIAF